MNAVFNNLRKVSGIVSGNILKNGCCITRIQHVIIKSDLKITWVRPEKIPSTSPRMSGDGGLKFDVKDTDIANRYADSKELTEADELVKKLFTLEFFPKRHTEELRREKTLALVKRHEADRGSMEALIALQTSEILHLQQYLTEHRRNKRTKHFLKELIDKRRKFLGKLRRWDYKRFEWLIEKLNLVFKRHPLLYERIERKASWRKVTTLQCEETRQQKLDAYRQELQAQQKDFFREKVEKLAFIRAEEIACGLTPSVSEEEIAAARKKAEEYE